MELNSFFTSLGLKGGDIIETINEKAYNLDNIYEMISVRSWTDKKHHNRKIKREVVKTIKEL
jgi:hypothetical protein